MREVRDDVEAKLARLPTGSCIRAALTASVLDAAFERAVENDSDFAQWPPLVLFCKRRSEVQLAAFEADLRQVVRHSRRKSEAEVTAFLTTGPGQDRQWCGGLFELAVKARLLQIPGLAVEIDVPLPNGLETDVRVYWRGGETAVECTIIAESDEDRKVWRRFIADQRSNEPSVLMRPGRHDVKDGKSPSPYYDTVRVYSKVYEKLAKDDDPANCQFPSDTPSVLALSFWSPTAPFRAGNPGVGWALDELFSDQPRKRTIAEGEAGIEIALGGCIERALQNSGLNPAESAERWRGLVNAPRRLGGMLLFDECRLSSARLNYNAHRACRVTHSEIARLEEWLTGAPCWL
jgi:hypothetical protein